MRETLRVVRCQASLGGRSDGRPRSCERLTFVIWRVLPVLRLRRARRLVWDVSRLKASSGQLNEGCETAPVMRATSVPSAQRMTLMPFPSTNASSPRSIEGWEAFGTTTSGPRRRITTEPPCFATAVAPTVADGSMPLVMRAPSAVGASASSAAHPASPATLARRSAGRLATIRSTVPVEGEAERGRQRPGEGKRARARHPERGDRLVREEAGPEPGSVSRRPDRQRKLEAPRLRHLAARLRKRQAQEPRLTARGEERERGRGEHGPVGAERRPEEREERPERGRRGDRGEREERDGGSLSRTAPAHGGSEGLHHREPSGRPGAGDARKERGAGDGGLDQQRSPES